MIFLKDHKDDGTKIGDGDGFLKGQLLVSTPALQDSCFTKSVILLCDHSKTGGMGLIINKHLRNIDQDDLYTRLGLEKPVDTENHIEVYFGGPVETTRGFVVHSDEYKTTNTVLMGNGIAVTSEHQILRDYLAGSGPQKLMLVMGYSGWTSGQLEKEIEENSWLALPADSELVFNTHDDSKWQTVGTKFGIDINQINPIIGNA